MRPVQNIILFSTASGAGNGMLVLLAVFAVGDIVPESRWFGFLAFGLAFGAIALGLLASTFHISHRGRAWLAFTQWRSSWLSRLAVLSVATFLPGLLFAFGWVVLGTYQAPWGMFGMMTAVLSFFSIYCTGMVHATLHPIIAWSNRFAVTNHLLLGLWTGIVWLNLLINIFGERSPPFAMVLMLVGFFAFFLKRKYWRYIDSGRGYATPESATGLGGSGLVRLSHMPDTKENFVRDQMTFEIAREEVEKWRRRAFIGLFGFPLPALLLTMESEQWIATTCAVLGAVSVVVGVVAERWLFFAEARHTASFYFGAQEA